MYFDDNTPPAQDGAPESQPTQPAGETPRDHLSEQEKQSLSGAAAAESPAAHPVEFASLEPATQIKPEVNFNLLMDVALKVSVEVGSNRVLVKDLLKMGNGSVIELSKTTNEPVDILVNDKPFAKGEIVVVEDYFGVRITEIVSPQERINNLK